MLLNKCERNNYLKGRDFGGSFYLADGRKVFFIGNLIWRVREKKLI